MFLVDSHCHLEMLDLAPQHNDVSHYIARAHDAGVKFFLNVSVSMAEFPALLRTAQAYPNVAVSVGLHPNEQDEEVDTDTLVRLASNPKVIAIGETGLDYYRSTGETEWQRERFRRHIKAAKLVNKPLIIHMREAKEDTLRIMREEGADQVGGVMHCFSENWETAREAMALNFYISFSGTVTFKNAVTIQEVAKIMPIDKMLIETDSPYLAPTPKRGKPNEPAYVRYTADYLSALRGMKIDDFAEQTTNNFFTLFNGAVRPHV